MDITEFLQMGGYAFYVWFSYGVTFLVLLINYLIPMQREKRLIKEITKRSLSGKNS